MQGLTGGELLFRRGQSVNSQDEAFRLTTPKNQYVTTFLANDEDRSQLGMYYSEKLSHLRDLRTIQRRVYEGQIFFERKMAPEKLRAVQQQALSKIEELTNRIKDGVQKIVKGLEVAMMKGTLQYFSLIKQEMIFTSERRKDSHESFQREVDDAKTIRDLLLFSKHVAEESRGCISLSYMEKDSTQFKRCEKAVLDNIGGGFDRKQLKVLHVLKLDHRILSRALQSAMDVNSDKKVKGLFAFVPKSSIYSLCTFGLRSQELPTEKPLRRYNDGDVYINRIFKSSWLSTEPKFPRSSSESESGVALPRPRNYGAALGLAKSRHLTYWRFSKKSTPSRYASEEIVEGYAYLVLCRVFVVELLTINEPFSEDIIRNAIESGYDAIFSNLVGEYVLLEPDYVLPEFIIQVSSPRGQVTEICSRQLNPMRTIFVHNKDIPSPTYYVNNAAEYISSLNGEESVNTSSTHASSGERPEMALRTKAEEKRDIVVTIGNTFNDFLRQKASFVKSVVPSN